ncbi:MAG: NAD(P)-binding protein, partial [Burkholderiales bacterium]
MGAEKPIEIAVIGGGCASVTAAFELTRPEHRDKYHVTVYQMGWRLGGKGASGRGPAGRIEEHGLHVWLGFYENAFRLLRECYAELDRDPAKCWLATWRDAFFADQHVGIADPSSKGGWLNWTAYFPPADGLPGDPLSPHNPFTVKSYVVHTAALLRALLLDLETRHSAQAQDSDTGDAGAALRAEEDEDTRISADSVLAKITDWLKLGALTSIAGMIEAAALLEVVVKALPTYPENVVLRLLHAMAEAARGRLEDIITADDDIRCKWEIIDLVLAILVGAVRFRLLLDPRGLEAIDHYECREWLRLNGASERSLNSAFVRGLYDLALAYEGGDPERPGLAAG